MKRTIEYVEPGGNQHSYSFPPPLHPRITEIFDELPHKHFSARSPFVRVPGNWRILLGP